MHRARLGAFSLAGLVLALGSARAGAVMITAQFLPGASTVSSIVGSTSQLAAAESFPASVSGELSTVQLQLIKDAATDTLDVDFYSASGDLPGTLLGSVATPFT